ncbi:MAG: PHP-associated domain-containing protein, partial [Anaerolineaceae bacterium]|nr:PHP-associated domain-containing protein [Anaerolineaceae bacterium]
PERVIVGVEIKTNKGELLAYFVQEEVPSGLEPAETIRLLKQQGAVISVSHPFDPHRSGWGMDDLKELIPHVDAIEVFNARSLSGSYNRAAADFARAANLSPTAGSDAHILAEIGGAVVLLPHFVNAEELRLALGQASIQCRLAPFWVHFGSTFAFLKKKLQHGAS